MNTVIMNCSNCKALTGKTISDPRKVSVKELKTKAISDVHLCLYCPKCHMSYCESCKKELGDHYEFCTGTKNERVMIFTNSTEKLPFDSIWLPDELGGQMVTVSRHLVIADTEYLLFNERDDIAHIMTDGRRGFIISPKCIKQIFQMNVHISVGEKLCNDVLCEIFPTFKFKKERPKWLRNDVTGRPIELDIYCDALKLAVEYQGKQHYEFVPFFHGTVDKFQAQVARDILKVKGCQDKGINLICVPFSLKKRQDIVKFIVKRLNDDNIRHMSIMLDDIF
jgi:hypothetical protein